MATLLSHRDFFGNYPIKSAVVIADGDFVGIDSTGQALLADCDVPQEASGIAKVSFGDGVTSRTGVSGLTERCSIYRKGKIGGLSSLTIDGKYWLSATGGAGSQTPTYTDAATRQLVGRAVSATEVEVDVQQTMVRYDTTAATTYLLPIA